MTDQSRRHRPSQTAAEHDAALVARVRQSDQQALAALYDRLGGLVYTLALRIVGEPDDASEVTQDVFLRVWQHADQFQPTRGTVGAWLMGMTRNRAIDRLRQRQTGARQWEDELSDAAVAAAPATDDPTEQVARRQVVRAALAALSPEERQMIALAYYGGLTQLAIAARLGLPLGTVKTRMRAAMAHLRRLLSADDREGW